MQELESERAEVLEQKRALDAKVAETAIQRPDAETVQGRFKDFVRLWDMATEDKRMTLLPLIVDRVELHEKERGFCRLLFTAQNPRLLRTTTSKNVVTRSQLEARQEVIANHFSLLTLDSLLLSPDHMRCLAQALALRS